MQQVAIITGGGRGLGRAFARTLANIGMRVAVASRTMADLDATVALIRADGGSCLAIPTDITNETAVRRMVSSTEEKLGPVDVLINSAGVGPPYGPMWNTDAGQWWTNIEVNLKGTMLCCHAVIGRMIERKRGRIINIASGAGTAGIPYMSAYVTAKTAIIRLTEVLAHELRPHGVSLFAIQPGTVRTAMTEELIQSEAGKQWLPWFSALLEEGRADSTKPGEDLVLYLASGQADLLSGRFFAAPDAPSHVVGQEKRILRDDSNVLRLRL